MPPFTPRAPVTSFEKRPTSAYFACAPRSEVGPKLVSKIESHAKHDAVSRMAGIQHDAYLYYYGFDPAGFHATSAVHRKGEQGELADFRVNHARALVNALKNLITSQKIIWRPKAASLDSESVRETELASNILEYYWSERQVAAFADLATEMSIALTEGFVFMPWDEHAGEIVEEGDEPGEFIMSGDVSFYVVPPWDVIRDVRKPSWAQNDWVIVRLPWNRYDLAQRYSKVPPDTGPNGRPTGPALWERILQVPEEVAVGRTGRRSGAAVDDSCDDISVYYFYHRRCAALPKGREAIFLADGTVLHDETLGTDRPPLHRITPAEMFGTPFGYSPFIEVMGIQELIDSLASTIATNQMTFGVQNVIVPQGTSISPEDLAGGLRVFYAPAGGGKPEALQLTQTPKEIFEFFETLKSDQTRLFGLNDVVLGEPPSGEMSGAGMALLSQQALQQSSTLQANYIRLVQDIGTCLLDTLRRKCWVPRKIDIVGKTNSFLVKPPEEYSGENLGRISKVVVEIGNPLEQTPSGRFELGQQMQQLGVKLNTDQVQQVLSTGRIDPLTRGLQSELLNIMSENESIAAGTPPTAMLHDDHLLHCREHRIPVSNPEARKDPKILAAHVQHVHQHYELFYGVPPETPMVDPMTGQPVVGPDGKPMMMKDPLYHDRMLLLMGMQPPPPMGGPIGPEGPPPGAPPGPDGPPLQEPEPPGAVPGNEPPPVQLPSMPKNPVTDQKWDPATAGGAVMPPGA